MGAVPSLGMRANMRTAKLILVRAAVSMGAIAAVMIAVRVGSAPGGGADAHVGSRPDAIVHVMAISTDRPVDPSAAKEVRSTSLAAGPSENAFSAIKSCFAHKCEVRVCTVSQVDTAETLGNSLGIFRVYPDDRPRRNFKPRKDIVARSSQSRLRPAIRSTTSWTRTELTARSAKPRAL